ncbi:MAG: 2-polyprenylphenol 6-hydroxylase [Alphaproteobacteria bacterium]|nr:2-polyprenylphenol 6-hydroxylase [Alphaproteobacteria bacterium]
MFRALRNLHRLVRIALTLARHGALDGLERVGTPPSFLVLANLFRRTDLPPRPGQRLALALTALGPSFVKLGQALSTRADLVGEAVAADLSSLQDKLAPFPGEQARATIVTELGQPVETLFRRFDDAAVAAASIAQVHFATAADGNEVAVKVLRPGVERLFARDIDLFLWLAELAERLVPRIRRLKPVAVVRAFEETVRLEMDLRLEAAAAAELGQNFTGDPDFRVPKVDWARTARRVLTLERVGGLPVDERAAIETAGHEPRAVVGRAARAFFNQVFRDGFFHADMHPGNLFVAADGSLVAVDFGIMGRIDLATREALADMLIGFLHGDYAKVAEVHFRAGFVPYGQSMGAFTQACRAIAEPILDKPLNEISLARLLAQLFEVTEQFQMETQPQLLLLQKSMLVCEGVGRKLAPELNMWELARPLIEEWMLEHRGPAARTRSVAEQAVARIEELPAFVGNLEKAAAMLAAGGVRLHPDSLAALGAGQPRGSWWPWAITAGVVAAAIFLLA